MILQQLFNIETEQQIRELYVLTHFVGCLGIAVLLNWLAKKLLDRERGPA